MSKIVKKDGIISEKNQYLKNDTYEIEDNIGFIIKVISSVTNAYVSIEHDDLFSIGLMGFNEAKDKFDAQRGNFYSYAKLVIESRILTYLKKENKENNNCSLDELLEKKVDFLEKNIDINDEQSVMREEIMMFKEEIAQFGLSFEDLVQYAPKHRDTRKNSVNLAKNISEDKIIVDKVYMKKRLPIKEISLKFFVTEKFVKRNKIFILATTVVFVKKLRNIVLWIREAVQG